MSHHPKHDDDDLIKPQLKLVEIERRLVHIQVQLARTLALLEALMGEDDEQVREPQRGDVL